MIRLKYLKGFILNLSGLEGFLLEFRLSPSLSRVPSPSNPLLSLKKPVGLESTGQKNINLTLISFTSCQTLKIYIDIVGSVDIY